ncbi:MAG: hypothetical protein PHR28_10220 [candidate division Zixibacteria bacterium]|nr:hypothetical protein [candidate division Zixibacteria bacterium]
MEYSYYFDEAKRLIHIKKTGTVTPDEEIAFIKTVMADPKFRKGMSSISDLTDASYDWSLQDVDRFRAFVYSIADAAGPCKWALVANGGITQAAARMFIVLYDIHSDKIRIKLFSNKFDAVKWVQKAGE